MNTTRLGDITGIITSGSRGWASYYSDDGALFLRMTNLPKNGIELLLNDKKFVKLPEETSEAKRTAVQDGDILISITAELGKIGFVENIPQDEVYVNQHVCLARPLPQKVNPKFLAYYLSSQTQRNLLNRLNDAGAKSGLNLQTISKFPIRIPDRRMQDFIVEVLEQWDAAIEKTEILINAKERQFEYLRTNIIKNTNNTASKKFRDFLKESRIPDTVNNSEKRLTVRLHLKGVDVREYRGTEKEGATQYFMRKAGQLIYGKQNIFRGSIGIIPHKLDGYSSSQDIPAFDINKGINADWLYWYMSRPRFYEGLEHFSAGSGSKRLHPKELFRMCADVPPIEEQERIAHTLNTAQQEITLLKKLANQYRTQKRGLMQKLLTGKWHVKNKEVKI